MSGFDESRHSLRHIFIFVVDERKGPVPFAAGAANRADISGVEVGDQQADGGDADAALFPHGPQRRVKAGHLPFYPELSLLFGDEILEYLTRSAAMFAYYEAFTAEFVKADIFFYGEAVLRGAEEGHIIVH